MNRVRGLTGQLRAARRSLRRYSFAAVARGILIRRHFQEKQLIVRPGRGPRPLIENRGRLSASVCAIWPGVRIEVARGAQLSIGKGTYLNRNTVVVCHERIDIGANCRISWDVVILDTDEHQVPGGGPVTAPVTIGDGAWVGCRAIVLKGVTVGAGAIVAAGAIVTRDVPPGALVAGQPAKVIRMLPGGPPVSAAD